MRARVRVRVRVRVCVFDQARNAEIADVWNDGDEAMNRHGKKDTQSEQRRGADGGGPTSPSKKTYAQMAAESAARGAKRAPIHDNVDAWAGE